MTRTDGFFTTAWRANRVAATSSMRRLRLLERMILAGCQLAKASRSRAALAMMSERDLRDLGLLRFEVRHDSSMGS